ncbi:MAG: TraR/DksA C4-type zinc finger protein [Gammaproteobacteria bacterium]|nr:TraR/DksA C4-type zinc finger protein [Gammaproteobacteria bacterium]
MSKANENELRERLVTERDEILEQVESSGQSGATVELDQSRTGRLSRMDALQAQAMAKASGERAKRRLLLIEAALRRMDAGEYGECRECGEIIAPGRLQADPCALFCVDCASNRQY